MNYHDDPLYREQVIARYLLRQLDQQSADAFEAHYLGCDECFQELGAADLMVSGLLRHKLNRQTIGEVTVLRFDHSAELINGSRDLEDLTRNVLEQKDSRVLIDLSRVSRIDSAGLGELMRMYTHLVRGGGALKVLNPSHKVETVMKLTRIDSVVELYRHEEAALQSFA